MDARPLFILRRYLFAVVAIALLSYPAAAVADVLILKNGSRIEGKVKVCDEEHCAVGARRVVLDQIARIELRSGVAVPEGAGAGSIVLVDGTVRTARFTGLSLGVVDIDGVEIDRDQVAVIILAGPSPTTGRPAAVPGDVLILADGTKRVGRLTTCTAASCRLDSKLVPLDSVRWIGLREEGSEPPQAEDTADIIFRKEQSVRARLGGIDATTVRSTRGDFAREDVLWIHLAPPLKGEPPGGVIINPEPEPQPQGGSASDKGKDKTSPPPQPGQSGSSSDKGKGTTSGKTPGTRVKPCPADKPLGGKVLVTQEHFRFGCRGTKRAVLRFPLGPKSFGLLPNPKLSWNDELLGGFQATEISYEISSDGCTGTYFGGDIPCDAPGGRRVGRLAGPFVTISFEPLLPALDGVVLPEAIDFFRTVGKCVGPRFTSRLDWQVGLHGFGIGPHGQGRCTPVDEIIPGCIDPAVCYRPKDPDLVRACNREADRYAVIPFVGHSDWTSPQANDRNYMNHGIVSYKIQWEVCCGCAAQPAVENGPPSPDDGCPDTLEADSRLETNRIEKEQKFKERTEHSKAAEKHRKEAQAHYDDFRKTVKACAIQNLATTLIIGLLTPVGEGAAAGEDMAEAWKLMRENGFLAPTQFQLIAKITEKLSKGEDPTTALLPEEVQTLIETAAAMELVKSSFKGANVEQMEKSMEDCAGAFLVSAETKLSADKGVEAFKLELEEQTEVQKLTNDLRDLDLAYPDLQYRSFEACVKRARCKGTPESACADKKPPGDWPDVH